MKAFLLLAMACVSATVAVPRLQKLDWKALIPTPNTTTTTSPDGTTPPGATLADNPVAVATPEDEVLRKYGEPTRKERAMDGTISWFYPVYVIYVRNGRVVNSCRVGAATTAVQSRSGSILLWRNPIPTVVIGTTGTTVWEPHGSTLGSTTLNGSTLNGGAGGVWQHRPSTVTGVSVAGTTSVWQGRTSGPTTVVVRPTTVTTTRPVTVARPPTTNVVRPSSVTTVWH